LSTAEILLENVRVAFPNLTSKHAIEGFPNSVPKYGLTVLLEPTDPQCQMIRDAVNELARAQWGDNYQNIVNNLVAQGARACFFGDGNVPLLLACCF
jgi:hypothetical protein